MQTKTQLVTRTLLLSGAIAGPLFILTVLVQDYTRPGFDPRLMPLSLLSLGDWGWVQVANFVLAGVLNLLYAVGLWRTLHPGPAGTFGPLLIGVYGLGLITVGIFTTDPAHDFPPGVPAPGQPSGHGIIHALGALFVFLSLAAALVVFVRFFLGRKDGWMAFYCLASAGSPGRRKIRLSRSAQERQMAPLFSTSVNHTPRPELIIGVHACQLPRI